MPSKRPRFRWTPERISAFERARQRQPSIDGILAELQRQFPGITRNTIIYQLEKRMRERRKKL